MDWTDEMIGEMRRLVAKRLTFSAIAQGMSAKFNVPFTRSQIAGACARRGIKLPRPAPTVKMPSKPKPILRLVSSREAAAQQTPSGAHTARQAHAAMEDISQMLGPMNDFPARECCQWIEGEPGHTKWQCCARPVHMGTFYCAGHLARTVTPTKPYRQHQLERMLQGKAPGVVFTHNLARFEKTR